MSTRDKSVVLVAWLTLAVMPLSGILGCGGSDRDDDPVYGGPAPLPPPGPAPTPTYTPGGDEPPGGFDDDGTMPPMSYSFSIAGKGTWAPSGGISTDSILRIRVRSGGSGQLTAPGYGNWSTNYGCIQYSVNVNGRSVVTPIMKVEGLNTGNCSSGPTSVVYDFSNNLGEYGNPNISVSGVKYDFYCQLYWQCVYNPWSLGGPYGSCYGLLGAGQYWSCPVKAPFDNHTTTGSLIIQVNGTTAP